MLNLAFDPNATCWVHKRGASIPLLAVSSTSDPTINIYDGRGEQQTPVHTISGLHKSPVCLMAYNDTHDCVVSADEGGMLEYWSPTNAFEKPDNVFEYKSSTNLFEFKKVGFPCSTPCHATVPIDSNSPNQYQHLLQSLPMVLISPRSPFQIARSVSSTFLQENYTGHTMNPSRPSRKCNKQAPLYRSWKSWTLADASPSNEISRAHIYATKPTPSSTNPVTS